MSDTKLSELTATTTPAATDLLYIVQSLNSRKITLESLLGAVPVPLKLTKPLSLGGTPQTIVDTDDADLTVTITNVSVGDDNIAITLDDGVEGQIKVFVVSAKTGSGNVTITGNFLDGFVNDEFAFSGNVGSSLVLIFSSTKWIILSYRSA